MRMTYFYVHSLCSLSGLSVRSHAPLVPQERMVFRYSEDIERHFPTQIDS